MNIGLGGMNVTAGAIDTNTASKLEFVALKIMLYDPGGVFAAFESANLLLSPLSVPLAVTPEVYEGDAPSA
ncbi:MAG: hypothetical protein JWP89_2649 [Schlesneria sp.]|nr:hypothetical protein [Schlesneria sp.]